MFPARKPPTVIRRWVSLLLATLWILLGCGHPAGAAWLRVKWVNDGDTIVLADERRVRYIGIDSPEMAHGDQKAEPFARAALKYNLRLTRPNPIRLEFDQERQDAYKRWLAYVYLQDGTLVNARLLERGYAHCYQRKPNVKYAQVLLSTQRSAMKARRGIWRDWREDMPGPFIGNRNSHRFHRTDCPLRKEIHGKNRVVFTTRWNAFWAGFAPCKHCGASEG